MRFSAVAIPRFRTYKCWCWSVDEKVFNRSVGVSVDPNSTQT